MQYAYWAVICKSEDCGLTLLPKGGYIGACEPTQHLIHADFGPPDSVDLPCPRCDNDHTYKAADFLIVRLDHRFEPEAELGA